MAKTAPTKPLTKTELMANIANATEQVTDFMEAIAAEIQESLINRGAGKITIPGLVKIEKKVLADKAEKGPAQPGSS